MKRRALTTLTLASALALMAAVPPATGDDAAPGYAVDEVGAPLSDVNIRTAATGALPDGTPVMYAPTYGEPALLSVLNGTSGELISVHELGDKTTANYTGVSPDGSAYVAGQTPGANLFRYDPTTDAVTDLGAPVSGETNISRLTSFADDGTLYSGTFPNGHVFSYHPERGFDDFGPIAAGEQYARSTAFDGDETLYVGTGTNARLFELNVTTGDKTEISMPEEYAGTQTYVNEMYYRDGLLFAFLTPAYAYVVYDTVADEWLTALTDIQASPISPVVDGSVYFVNRTPNDIFSYDLATGTVQPVTDTDQFSLNTVRGFGTLELPDPEWPGTTLAGMGLTGQMWHYNLETGQLRWLDSEAAAGALKIAALGMAPDDTLYAAGYLTPGTMARIDIDSLAHESLRGPSQSQFIGTVATEGAAPMMYIGGYNDAGVWRFDPTRDWGYPSNPVRIARLDGYDQERILAIANAGADLAVTALNPKGALGGHLTILNPLDSTIAYSDEPVPDYAVASVLYQEIGGDRVLIGGTTSHQLGIEHPDPAARLFVFDLDDRTTRYVTIPRPDATSITRILELPDGRIWAFANDSTILELEIQRDDAGAYAIQTTEVTSIFGEPRGAGNWAGARMSMLDENTIVGNAAGWVYTVDVDTHEVTVITEGSEATPTGDGRFFFARSTNVFRATPDGWVPPPPDDSDPDPVTHYNYALADNGGRAEASSQHGGYGADQVIDGDTTSVTSRWISAAGDPDPSVQITFGNEVPIDSVGLYQYPGYELSDYDISANVDGQWATVAQIRGNRAPNPVHTFDGVQASALRIDNVSSTDGRVRLYEVEATCRLSTICPDGPPSTTARYVGTNWVTLTLTVDDAGSRAERTEFRFGDSEEWATYSEPLTLKRSDRQELQYRSIGLEGTIEDTHCIRFRPGGGQVYVVVAPEDAACTG